MALKTFFTPWKWFRGQYVEMHGPYGVDPSYLEYDEDPVKARLMSYDWAIARPRGIVFYEGSRLWSHQTCLSALFEDAFEGLLA